ncbi:hypothetical protein IMZ48_02085 [Candidatus Bathyarchaeota archaeon]|nr:hypothetical protein [Candidatus Bathyarchaeota archaeon]
MDTHRSSVWAEEGGSQDLWVMYQINVRFVGIRMRDHIRMDVMFFRDGHGWSAECFTLSPGCEVQ